MKFEKRLALTGFLRQQFGVANIHDKQSVRTYHKRFSEDATGAAYNADGHSKVYQVLKSISRLGVEDDKLREYDKNIYRHQQKINKNRPGDKKIDFKYFQILAGLYTEYYLDRVTDDKEELLNDLNAFVKQERKNNKSKVQYSKFEPTELNKLAFWMATGSGKTLIMHLNYYQFQHYAPRLDQQPDNILLITPNAGLTHQHQKELSDSGIPNQYYLDPSSGSGADPASVKVIEITKLTDKKSGDGDSIEVSSFEGNNLVFVDEGHKGSGKEDSKWMRRRKEISAQGFTFEYSATFGQSLNKADASTQDEYGKAIVFDYSYPRFYDDGYGKNYNILNLKKQQRFEDAGQRHTYMLANLLSFFEQKYIYAQNAETFYKTWNLHDPLLTFIGHSVQAGKTKSSLAKDEKRTVSDVQKLVLFLNEVLQNNENWAVQTIDRLLNGDSGIEGPDGTDIFENRFEVLKQAFRDNTAGLYSNLLQAIFHVSTSASLKLNNIKSSDGEIGLRAGTQETYFGVINIGEDSVFLQFVEENLPDLIVEEGDAFEGSLFQQINKQKSPVNVLIGSKKFIEGWSSWRVANMGLMNIGKSEGPQIIQLFGRGVRLLGKQRSLQRSSAMKNETKPANIELLETLQIFGLQANYMDQFRKYLKQEGIDTEERIHLNLDIKYPNTFENKGLLVIKKSSTMPEFKDVEHLVLEIGESFAPKVNLKTKIEIQESADRVDDDQAAAPDSIEKQYLSDNLLPLLSFERLFREVWHYRGQKGYTNLTFNQKQLKDILTKGHYELYCDDSSLEVDSFKDIQKLEEIALIIFRKYIDRFYKKKQQEWEYKELEYRPFTKGDKNIPSYDDGEQGYQLRVKKTAVDRIEAEIKEMFEDEEIFQKDVTKSKDGAVPRLYFDRHIYLPLLLEDDNKVIESTPPGLNEGEWKFAKALKEYFDSGLAKKLLKGYDVYVMRNQSRGHGVGFLLEEERYFPDFIIWVKNKGKQHILFVDPKGLQHQINLDENPKVQFAKEIKTYQKQLNKKHDKKDVELHSFIISQTARKEVEKNNSVTSISQINDYNVFFPGQDGYVDSIFRKVLDVKREVEY